MKTPARDIVTSEDIRELVFCFYEKVGKDELLAPVFNARVGDHWPEHLKTMNSFWETVLLGTHSYTGNPLPLHVNLPIDHSHFERWLNLFRHTISELFTGEKADEAQSRAASIATIFEAKLRAAG